MSQDILDRPSESDLQVAAPQSDEAVLVTGGKVFGWYRRRYYEPTRI